MPSSIDKADVVPFDYRPDAIKIARHVAEHGKLPGSFTSYHIENSFRFAVGRLPQSLRQAFNLGDASTFSDLGRAIERRLNPPKPEGEPTYVGDRRLTPRELRLEAAARKAEAEGDAAPAATDWRAAIKGE
jgi:hypothetical protein